MTGIQLPSLILFWIAASVDASGHAGSATAGPTYLTFVNFSAMNLTRMEELEARIHQLEHFHAVRNSLTPLCHSPDAPPPRRRRLYPRRRAARAARSRPTISLPWQPTRGGSCGTAPLSSSCSAASGCSRWAR